MAHLTSHQALKLAADFACKPEQMRTSGGSDFRNLANIYERTIRVAFCEHTSSPTTKSYAPSWERICRVRFSQSPETD
jgi:hypothetical protein